MRFRTFAFGNFAPAGMVNRVISQFVSITNHGPPAFRVVDQAFANGRVKRSAQAVSIKGRGDEFMMAAHRIVVSQRDGGPGTIWPRAGGGE